METRLRLKSTKNKCGRIKFIQMNFVFIEYSGVLMKPHKKIQIKWTVCNNIDKSLSKKICTFCTHCLIIEDIFKASDMKFDKHC